jgi:hypothetical protein
MTIDETTVRPEHKAVTIIVNTREKTVTEKEMSFDEVVHLAYETPPSGSDVLFTVIYHRARGEKPEGTLVEGQAVKVHDGMVFDVTPTTRS